MSDKSSEIFKVAKAVHDTTKYPEVRKIMAKVIQLMQRGPEHIEFQGQKYPPVCVCCQERIEASAIVLLGTSLIFVDEDHLVRWIGDCTADITIREVGPCTPN